jgi:hypothetical protein
MIATDPLPTFYANIGNRHRLLSMTPDVPLQKRISAADAAIEAYFAAGDGILEGEALRQHQRLVAKHLRECGGES